MPKETEVLEGADASTDDMPAEVIATGVLPAPVAPMADVTVTKKGDGKISTGVHQAGVGDLTYPRGANIQVPADAVAELEERGWIEAD